jgi:hypothetical protein
MCLPARQIFGIHVNASGVEVHYEPAKILIGF